MEPAKLTNASEPLTWAEICERYPEQYVWLVDIDSIHPRDPEFRTARVLAHGKSRFAAAERAGPRDTIIIRRFTGTSEKTHIRPRVILSAEDRKLLRIRW